MYTWGIVMKPLKHPLKISASSVTIGFVMLLSAVALAEETVLGKESQPEKKERMEEVLVSGQYNRFEFTNLLSQTLSGNELVHRRQGGIGETLAGLPGVHMDNFGGGASRPVIRGQSLPRIEVLSNGASLFDVSSASPDHAIVTDPLLLDAVEVLRGPTAAIYGGNAVNGAINLIDSKVPRVIPKNGLTGAVELRSGWGDEEETYVGRVTAGLGQFAIHVEGSQRDSEDYSVPSSFGSNELRDSFAESSNYSVGASWITDKGYIGAAYTEQQSEYGLPGHSHTNAVCHTHGRDLHCEGHGGFRDPFVGFDDTHTAQIDLNSERIDIRADYGDLLPGIAHTRMRLSYTDYRHKEIDGDTVFSNYSNEVYDARLELTHKPLLGFTGTFGIQYTDGTFSGINYNDAHEGVPELDFNEPDYETKNYGIFLSERKSLGPVDLEIALRKDWRDITIPTPQYNFTEMFLELLPTIEEQMGMRWIDFVTERFHEWNPDSKHNPFSASLGATWNFAAGYSAALTLARSERAPSVRELYAYGNNLATNSYELGLATAHRAHPSFGDPVIDTEETTKSVDLAFRKQSGSTLFEIGLFYQEVDDYIFASLIETEDEGGSPHNYLLYRAADAKLRGIDGQVSYQFNHASRLTVFGDYVRASLEDEEDDDLPRTPPGRFGARYDWIQSAFSANLEYIRTLNQGRIASYETKTDGYDLINMTLSYGLDLGSEKSMNIYIRGTNLTNELAFVHTSFVKDQSPLRGRNIAFGVGYKF